MKYLFILLLLAILGFGIITYRSGGILTSSLKPQNPTPTQAASLSPTGTLVGNDRDEHGCIGSAGYSWCEAKQTCLRSWEEPCTKGEDTTPIIEAVRAAIIAKRGPSAEELTITVSEIEGNYAKGGASSTGGGGMWFAAKVNNVWKLVWDGNGIILCSDLTSYPAFPTSMIPQCYNDQTDQMVTRKSGGIKG